MNRPKRRPSELAQRALQLEAQARNDFLELECEGDPVLRQEVEELMLLLQGAGAEIRRPEGREEAAGPAAEGEIAGADPAAPEGADIRPLVSSLRPPGEIIRGERVGPYRVLDPLGRGGFGVVYRAVRADDFKKQVAIKVIKKGMDSEELLARFRNERQILASLDHPYIAKMLDGGTLPDGRPYIVMDYIDGMAIDRYCQTQKLSVEQILQLFLQVCSAVHYAHQNLVIHRDLGPRNILVTEDGTPKLLDFGIAKLINPELSALTEVYTAPMQRVMTARYASPEQARGGKITTASDIYSLGVLLYELLTGRPPYRTKGRALEETIRIISEHEPLRPSAAVLVPRERSLPEEGKEPKGFEAKGFDGKGFDGKRLEIKGFDEAKGGEPPQPPPPPSPERLKVARQLQGDIDNIVLTAMRKEPSRRYPSVEHFAEDLRRHLDGRPITARKVNLAYRAFKWARRNKAWAAAMVMSVAFGGILMTFLLLFNHQLSIARDKAVAAQNQAEVIAQDRQDALDVLEKLKELLIDFLSGALPEEEADVTLGQALESRAPEMIAKLDEANSQEKRLKAELEDVVGRLYSSMGQLNKAEPYLRHALELRRSLFGDHHIKTAESKVHLAGVLRNQGQIEEAREMLETALVTIHELGEDGSELGAKAISNLSQFHPGDPAKQRELLEKALSVYQRFYGPETNQVLSVRQDIALTWIASGDLERAEEEARDILAQRQRQPRPNLKDIAVNRQNLGAILSRNLKLHEALEQNEQALDAFRMLYGEHHPDVARALMNVGVVQHFLGNLKDAEDTLRRAVSELKSLPDTQTEVLATAQYYLGATLIERGHYSEALAPLRSAVHLRSEASLSEKRQAEASCALAVAYLATSDSGSARPLLDECLPPLLTTWQGGNPQEKKKLEWLCEQLSSATTSFNRRSATKFEGPGCPGNRSPPSASGGGAPP